MFAEEWGSVSISELVPGEDVLVTWTLWPHCLGPGISHPCFKRSVLKTVLGLCRFIAGCLPQHLGLCLGRFTAVGQRWRV